MGEHTGIAWCNHTFNCWWGCTKISPACTNCYAATFDKRVGGDHWGPRSPRRFFGPKHWNEPLKWNRNAQAKGERARVFCASMADVFEIHEDDAVNKQLRAERRRLFDLIHNTPWLDWLLLTKRPENIANMVPWDGGIADTRTKVAEFKTEPPWPNVWIGTTVENQEYAEERIPHLALVPAVVRFLSCEPLLGPIDLTRLHDDEVGAKWNAFDIGIHWVIAGCESGPGARQTPVERYRELRDQCSANDAAYFLKQSIADIERCDGCNGVVIYQALSNTDAVASCKCCQEGPESCSTDGIMAGAGSWTKKIAGVDIIEQPYLDGVQHVAFPRPR